MKWARLLRYGRPEWARLGSVTVLMLVTIVFDALKPWPLKVLVDDVLAHEPLPSALAWLEELPGGSSSQGLAAWLAFATVLCFLLAGVALVVQRYVLAGSGGRMAYALARDVFAKLQRLPLAFHRRNRVGDLSKRVTEDSDCVRQLFAEVLLPVTAALITLSVLFTIMFRLDPELALVSVGVALPIAVVFRRMTGPMSEKSYRQYELEGEMLALAEQTLTALPVVQAFAREDIETSRFRSLSDRTVRAHLAVTRSQVMFHLMTTVVTGAGTAAVMIVGGLHVVDGRLSVGSLLVFLSYLVSLYVPVETLASITTAYASSAASSRRVDEILREPVGVDDAPDAVPFGQPVSGALAVDHVTFGYAADRPALHDVSFSVSPGETVALVGRTGAGKSTIFSLLPRFVDPWSGTVTVDGQDVRTVPVDDLRRNIAVVLQDPYLLPVTVAANIAYGRPDASRDDIIAAASAAAAHDFIVALPDGYDTVIGERGATLSGGERQRIAIARALLTDTPIVLLDEPTSAVDVQTEAEIVTALERLMEGRTTLVIAHRLSTVEHADRVLVVDDGRIIDEGAPAELLAREGLYKHLHDLQRPPGDVDADLTLDQVPS